MKVELLAQVDNIERKSDYPKNEHGKTLWDEPKIVWFESTLTILDNKFHIQGSIVTREQLNFGLLYKIFLNTEVFTETAQNQQVTDPDQAEIDYKAAK